MQTLFHAQALPVFLAFRYPVTVTNADPPIRVRLRNPAAISAPNVASAVLGDRELSVRVGTD
jgi:hypothetical protein